MGDRGQQAECLLFDPEREYALSIGGTSEYSRYRTAVLQTQVHFAFGLGLMNIEIIKPMPLMISPR